MGVVVNLNEGPKKAASLTRLAALTRDDLAAVNKQILQSMESPVAA